MNETGHFVLPSPTLADPASLVFLAPEFWGDPVVERVDRGDRPGDICWTRLALDEVAIRRRMEPARSAPREAAVEDLLKLTRPYEPPLATPSCVPPREAVPRSAISRAAEVASALGLSSALGLAGFAVAGLAIHAERPLRPTVAQGATLVPEPPPARVEEPRLAEPSVTTGAARGSALAGWTSPEPEEPAASEGRGRGPSRRHAPGTLREQPTGEQGPSVPTAALEAAPVEEMTFRRAELLPAAPTTGEVLGALRRVSSLVRNCSVSGPRTAPVSLTLSGSTGSVTAVELPPSLAGTPEGDCVERALRRVTVQRFADESHLLRRFPLVLR